MLRYSDRLRNSGPSCTVIKGKASCVLTKSTAQQWLEARSSGQLCIIDSGLGNLSINTATQYCITRESIADDKEEEFRDLVSC